MSDIIAKEILKKGYKNEYEFCTKNKITDGIYFMAKIRNSWTPYIIGKISRALGVDLSCYINTKENNVAKENEE